LLFQLGRKKKETELSIKMGASQCNRRGGGRGACRNKENETYRETRLYETRGGGSY